MALVEAGRWFDDGELALLKQMIGCTLDAYEGYAPFAESGLFFRTMRLHVGGAARIELVCEHETTPVGPDFEEEPLALLSARTADENAFMWTPSGRETTRVDVGCPIDDVLVVMDTVLLMSGPRELLKTRMVQAVALECAGGLIAFDRDIWSSEYLQVQTGGRISEVTRDMRGDWVVEPPHAYSFAREVLRLSQQR